MADEERELLLRITVDADDIAPEVARLKSELAALDKAASSSSNEAARSQDKATEAIKRRKSATEDLAKSLTSQQAAERKSLQESIRLLQEHGRNLEQYKRAVADYAKQVSEIETQNRVAQQQFRQGAVRKFQPIQLPAEPAYPLPPQQLKFKPPAANAEAERAVAKQIVEAEQAQARRVAEEVMRERKRVSRKKPAEIAAPEPIKASDFLQTVDRDALLQQMGQGPKAESVVAKQAEQIRASEKKVAEAQQKAVDEVVAENQAQAKKLTKAAETRRKLIREAYGKLLEGSERDSVTINELARELGSKVSSNLLTKELQQMIGEGQAEGGFNTNLENAGGGRLGSVRVGDQNYQLISLRQQVAASEAKLAASQAKLGDAIVADKTAQAAANDARAEEVKRQAARRRLSSGVSPQEMNALDQLVPPSNTDQTLKDRLDAASRIAKSQDEVVAAQQRLVAEVVKRNQDEAKQLSQAHQEVTRRPTSTPASMSWPADEDPAFKRLREEAQKKPFDARNVLPANRISTGDVHDRLRFAYDQLAASPGETIPIANIYNRLSGGDVEAGKRLAREMNPRLRSLADFGQAKFSYVPGYPRSGKSPFKVAGEEVNAVSLPSFGGNSLLNERDRPVRPEMRDPSQLTQEETEKQNQAFVEYARLRIRQAYYNITDKQAVSIQALKKQLDDVSEEEIQAALGRMRQLGDADIVTNTYGTSLQFGYEGTQSRDRRVTEAGVQANERYWAEEKAKREAEKKAREQAELIERQRQQSGMKEPPIPVARETSTGRLGNLPAPKGTSEEDLRYGVDMMLQNAADQYVADYTTTARTEANDADTKLKLGDQIRRFYDRVVDAVGGELNLSELSRDSRIFGTKSKPLDEIRKMASRGEIELLRNDDPSVKSRVQLPDLTGWADRFRIPGLGANSMLTDEQRAAIEIAKQGQHVNPGNLQATLSSLPPRPVAQISGQVTLEQQRAFAERLQKSRDAEYYGSDEDKTTLRDLLASYAAEEQADRSEGDMQRLGEALAKEATKQKIPGEQAFKGMSVDRKKAQQAAVQKATSDEQARQRIVNEYNTLLNREITPPEPETQAPAARGSIEQYLREYFELRRYEMTRLNPQHGVPSSTSEKIHDLSYEGEELGGTPEEIKAEIKRLVQENTGFDASLGGRIVGQKRKGVIQIGRKQSDTLHYRFPSNELLEELSEQGQRRKAEIDIGVAERLDKAGEYQKQLDDYQKEQDTYRAKVEEFHARRNAEQAAPERRKAITMDILDYNESGAITAQAWVPGRRQDAGGDLPIQVGSTNEGGRREWHTLGDDGSGAPQLNARTAKELVQKLAKFYGITGRAEIIDEREEGVFRGVGVKKGKDLSEEFDVDYGPKIVEAVEQVKAAVEEVTEAVQESARPTDGKPEIVDIPDDPRTKFRSRTTGELVDRPAVLPGYDENVIRDFTQKLDQYDPSLNVEEIVRQLATRPGAAVTQGQLEGAIYDRDTQARKKYLEESGQNGYGYIGLSSKPEYHEDYAAHTARRFERAQEPVEGESGFEAFTRANEEVHGTRYPAHEQEIFEKFRRAAIAAEPEKTADKVSSDEILDALRNQPARETVAPDPLYMQKGTNRPVKDPSAVDIVRGDVVRDKRREDIRGTVAAKPPEPAPTPSLETLTREEIARQLQVAKPKTATQAPRRKVENVSIDESGQTISETGRVIPEGETDQERKARLKRERDDRYKPRRRWFDDLDRQGLPRPGKGVETPAEYFESPRAVVPPKAAEPPSPPPADPPKTSLSKPGDGARRRTPTPAPEPVPGRTVTGSAPGDGKTKVEPGDRVVWLDPNELKKFAAHGGGIGWEATTDPARVAENDRILKSIRDNGFDPDYAPVLRVDQTNRKAMVSDGNHRTNFAALAGVDKIPVVIRASDDYKKGRGRGTAYSGEFDDAPEWTRPVEGPQDNQTRYQRLFARLTAQREENERLLSLRGAGGGGGGGEPPVGGGGLPDEPEEDPEEQKRRDRNARRREQRAAVRAAAEEVQRKKDERNERRRRQRQIVRERPALGQRMMEMFSDFQLPRTRSAFEVRDPNNPFENETEAGPNGEFISRLGYEMRKIRASYEPGSYRQGQIGPGRQPLAIGRGTRQQRFVASGAPRRLLAETEQRNEMFGALSAEIDDFPDAPSPGFGVPPAPLVGSASSSSKRRRSSSGSTGGAGGSVNVPGLTAFHNNLKKLSAQFDDTGQHKDHFMANLGALGGVFHHLGNQAGGLAGGAGGGTNQTGQHTNQQQPAAGQPGGPTIFPATGPTPAQAKQQSQANKAAFEADAARAKRDQAQDDRDANKKIKDAQADTAVNDRDTKKVFNDYGKDQARDNRDHNRIINDFKQQASVADQLNQVRQNAQHRQNINDQLVNKTRADADAARARADNARSAARATQIRADDAARAAARRARLDQDRDSRSEDIRRSRIPRGLFRGVAYSTREFLRSGRRPLRDFSDRFNREGGTFFSGPLGRYVNERAGFGNRLGTAVNRAANNNISGLFNAPRFFGNLRNEFTKTRGHAEGFFTSIRAGFRRAFADGNGRNSFGGFISSFSTRLSTFADDLTQSFSGMGRTLFSWRGLVILALAALGPLVAMLGSLAGGALAAGNTLVQLVGSMLALPGLLTAAASGVAALIVAFKPLSGILGAYADKQKAVNQANNSGISTTERARRAQEDLNKVRRDAKRELEDLQTAVNRANLSENGAILNVKQARQRYLESLADPNSSILDQQLAYQAYQEAQANLQDTRTKNKRNKEDLAALPAEQQRQIADAETAAAAGGDSSTVTASKELERQLKLAGPKTQAFALGLAKIFLDEDGPWKKTQKTIAEGLFGPLVPQLGNIEKLLGPLGAMLAKAAGAIGQLGADAIESFSSPEWTSFFESQGDSNVVLISNFGKAFLSIADALRDIAIAARPFTEWISEAFARVAQSFADWANEGMKDGSIADFLDQVKATLIQVGDIIGHLWTAFSNLFGGSNDFTRDFLGTLVKVTGEFAAWSEQAADPNSGFRKFLADTMPLLKQVGSFLVDIVKAFFQIASDPKNIEEAKRILTALSEDVLPAIVEFFTYLSESGIVSKLATAFGKFVDILSELLEHGGGTAMSVFVSGIEALISVLNWFVQFPGVATAIGVIGIALAGLGATALLLKFTGLAALIRGLRFLLNNKNDLAKVFKTIGGWFTGRNTPGSGTGTGGSPTSPLGGGGGGGGGAASTEAAILERIDIKLGVANGLLQRILACVCTKTPGGTAGTAGGAAAGAAGGAAAGATAGAATLAVAGASLTGAARALTASAAALMISAAASGVGGRGAAGIPIAATAFAAAAGTAAGIPLAGRLIAGGPAQRFLLAGRPAIRVAATLGSAATRTPLAIEAGSAVGAQAAASTSLAARLFGPTGRFFAGVGGDAAANIRDVFGPAALRTSAAAGRGYRGVSGFFRGIGGDFAATSREVFGPLAQPLANITKTLRAIPGTIARPFRLLGQDVAANAREVFGRTPAAGRFVTGTGGVTTDASAGLASRFALGARLFGQAAGRGISGTGGFVRSIGSDFATTLRETVPGFRSIGADIARPFAAVGRDLGATAREVAPGFRFLGGTLARPFTATGGFLRGVGSDFAATARETAPGIRAVGSQAARPFTAAGNFFRNLGQDFGVNAREVGAANKFSTSNIFSKVTPKLKTAAKGGGYTAAALAFLASLATAAQAPDTDAQGNELSMVDQLGGGTNVGIGATSGSILSIAAIKKFVPASVLSKIPGISQIASAGKNAFASAGAKAAEAGGAKAVGANLLSKLPGIGSKLLKGGGNPLALAGTALGIGTDLAYQGKDRQKLEAQFLRSQGAALTAAGYGAQFGGLPGAAVGYVAGNIYSLAKDKGYRKNLENAVTDPTSQYGNNAFAKTVAKNPILSGIAGIAKGIDQGDPKENVIVRAYKGGRKAFNDNITLPLLNTLKKFRDAVFHFLADLPKRLIHGLGFSIGFLSAKITQLVTRIGNWFSKLPARVTAWWKSWTFKEVWQSIVRNVFHPIGHFFSTLPDRVTAWWDSWTFGELWDKFWDAVIVPVEDWFKNIPDAVTEWWNSWSFGDLWDKFYDAFVKPFTDWWKDFDPFGWFSGGIGEGAKAAGGTGGADGDPSTAKQSGGLIEGVFDGRVDTKKAMLTAGEWVTRKRVVDKPMAKMLLSELNEERLNPADFYAALNGATRKATLSVNMPAMSLVGADAPGAVTNNSTVNHNRGGHNFGDVHIHNPIREKSDVSMRRTLHKLAYMSER